MSGFTTAALHWQRDHHGIATTERLSDFGVSRTTRQHLVRTGALVREYRGVYRIASQPLTLEARCAALCAFQPNGFITGPTAGRLHSLRRMPRTMTQPATGSAIPPVEIVHFAVPHGGRLDLPGVSMRQTCAIAATDVQNRADGIRIASPWRLAFDLAADLSATDLESVIEQILSKKLCGFVTLAATARRLARPARPGSAAFVSALVGRIPGGPLESHPEVRLAKALQARGVPVIAQVRRLDLADGATARLDLCVPDIRWGVEIDIHPDHFLQFGTADRRRDRRCHRIGWQVERVTAIDMLDVDCIADELALNFHARLAEMSQRSA